jgi:DNA-binding IclR family transcriptional regulator
VLVCIAHDPGTRLRDIAAAVGITERRAFAIVNDLTASGYVAKERDGRRNRYELQTHLPRAVTSEPTISTTLDLLVATERTERNRRAAPS